MLPLASAQSDASASIGPKRCFLSSSSSDEGIDDLQACYDEWEATTNALQEAYQQPESSRRRRRRTHIERGRERGFAQLSNDYFSEVATYPDEVFRRRFRMRKGVFNRIVQRLESEMVYFQQRPNCTGSMSISALQKITSAFRILAYGLAADACDEYLRLFGGTTRVCLSHFVDGIIQFFGDEYLRRPNAADIQILLSVGESRGFPGMLGNIDCMHWAWKKCPTAWKCQFAREDHGHPTIILEAVASYDLLICHAFFGVPGTNNDINILDRSLVFDDILQGRAPTINFIIGGHEYTMGYYLTDGIYPEWATFVKSPKSPQGIKMKLFAQHLASVSKDVEIAFGVLQSRFAIVRNPALSWDPVMLGKIMRACIILHNMIVEDEREDYSHHGYEIPQFDEGISGELVPEDNSTWTYSTRTPDAMREYIHARNQLRDSVTHHRLREDLNEHIWQKFGSNDGAN